MDDREFSEIVDCIYSQLKARLQQDPNSLGVWEKVILLAAAGVRLLDMEERLFRLREAAWQRFRRAETLVSEYEEGRYKGEDIVLDFWALLPAGCTNTCIRGFHDPVLAQKIYELRSRFQGLLNNVP